MESLNVDRPFFLEFIDAANAILAYLKIKFIYSNLFMKYVSILFFSPTAPVKHFVRAIKPAL
jgi:hypothetical protein